MDDDLDLFDRTEHLDVPTMPALMPPNYLGPRPPSGATCHVCRSSQWWTTSSGTRTAWHCCVCTPALRPTDRILVCDTAATEMCSVVDDE
jgi:hypothetical protein